MYVSPRPSSWDLTELATKPSAPSFSIQEIQANLTFVQEQAASLLSITEEERLKTCQVMHASIQRSTTQIETGCSYLETRRKRTVIKLVATEKDLSIIYEKNHSAIARLHKLEATMEGLQRKKAHFDRELRCSKQEIAELEEKVDKTWRNIATFGLYRHHKKKDLKKEWEEYDDLEHKRGVITNKIAEEKTLIGDCEDRIAKLEERKKKKDAKLKLLGKKVTRLGNVFSDLKLLLDKHQFLHSDVDKIRRFIHSTPITSHMIRIFKQGISTTNAILSNADWG